MKKYIEYLQFDSFFKLLKFNSSIIIYLNILLVIILVVIIYWIYKKLFFFKKNMNDFYIKVVDKVSIGPNQKIVIIDLKGKKIVLGITPYVINRLYTLPHFYKKNNTKN